MSLAYRIQLAFLKAIQAKNSWGKNEIAQLYIEIVNTVLIEELDKKENTNASS